MRAALVEIMDIFDQNSAEMLLIPDQQMVQTLFAPRSLDYYGWAKAIAYREQGVLSAIQVVR